MSELSKILQDYHREIHSDEADYRGDELFLRSIISSHRYLRGLNLEDINQRRANLEVERQRAYEYARDYALKHDYFSRDALRTMTIAELVDELHGGSEGG